MSPAKEFTSALAASAADDLLFPSSMSWLDDEPTRLQPEHHGLDHIAAAHQVVPDAAACTSCIELDLSGLLEEGLQHHSTANTTSAPPGWAPCNECSAVFGGLIKQLASSGPAAPSGTHMPLDAGMGAGLLQQLTTPVPAGKAAAVLQQYQACLSSPVLPEQEALPVLLQQQQQLFQLVPDPQAASPCQAPASTGGCVPTCSVDSSTDADYDSAAAVAAATGGSCSFAAWMQNGFAQDDDDMLDMAPQEQLPCDAARPSPAVVAATLSVADRPPSVPHHTAAPAQQQQQQQQRQQRQQGRQQRQRSTTAAAGAAARLRASGRPAAAPAAAAAASAAAAPVRSRAEALARYRAKREAARQRGGSAARLVRYTKRKEVADKRPRVGGRFIKVFK